MNILKYEVKKEDAGKKVELICKKEFDISSGLFINLKLNGKLKLNNEICRSIDIVKEGDILTADISENEECDIVPNELEFEILYEDESILVVNKPKEMAVHPSLKNYDNTLANGVMFHWKNNGEMHKFHIVNRLDKDTSGICVVAKNRYSHARLCQQIKNKTFKRKYMAVVLGKTENSGIIDAPIERVADTVMKREVRPDGKTAITVYKTIEQTEEYSLVDIELKTGRTHQIRVHFSYMGHPLAGDWLYGTEDRELSKGQALHAYKLTFTHPVTDEIMNFETKIPDYMVNFFQKTVDLQLIF